MWQKRKTVYMILQKIQEKKMKKIFSVPLILTEFLLYNQKLEWGQSFPYIIFLNISGFCLLLDLKNRDCSLNSYIGNSLSIYIPGRKIL